MYKSNFNCNIHVHCVHSQRDIAAIRHVDRGGRFMAGTAPVSAVRHRDKIQSPGLATAIRHYRPLRYRGS